MSFALRLLIVTAKDRFAGRFFSIWNGIKTWSSEIVWLFGKYQTQS